MSFILPLLMLFFVGTIWRPLERWEGSIAKRANQTKVPQELIVALDGASFPLMMILMFGLPSAVLLVPPQHVTETLGLGFVIYDWLFWMASAIVSYLIINLIRILIIAAWSFLGFASIRLYGWGKWWSLPGYIILMFVVLGPVTKASNLLLTQALGGLLSAFDGKVNYIPIIAFMTFFNVAMVLNGILKAPSQGQFFLQYFMEISTAIKDGNIKVIKAQAEAGLMQSIVSLDDFDPGEWEELDPPLAKKLLTKGVGELGRQGRLASQQLLRNRKTGRYAVGPKASDAMKLEPGDVIDLTEV